MRDSTIQDAAASERPLVTPLAHDALSARLIENAGFRAFAIGGSAMLAARYALPDLGIAALGEMAAGMADISAASSLPFFADADDGYGDAKAVAHTVRVYERHGASAIIIEDQDRHFKQQRAEAARGIVDEATIEHKLKVALKTRDSVDTWIIGRTDAYGPLGLNAAVKRAERFLKIGVDGVFIAGIRREEDYVAAASRLKGAFMSAAIFEGGETPWLTPAALGEMGYRHVSLPSALIVRVAAALSGALDDLRKFAAGEEALTPLRGFVDARRRLDDSLDIARWRSLEAH